MELEEKVILTEVTQSQKDKYGNYKYGKYSHLFVDVSC